MTKVMFLCSGNSCRSQMTYGTEEEVLDEFRKARDEIGQRVKDLIEEVRNG
jgi:protein-tyrosine-phosphatase